MSSRRKIAELAHQLFELSLDQGVVSTERVTGVLAWVDKHKPASASAVLRAYRRLVEADLGRRRAVIEYAGEVSPATFAAIASAMSKRFGRAIEAVPVPRPELIAGLRVRVGDNVFENNVVSQLAALQPTS
jgi:F-type H+-transporting ATPase subunit delta